VSARIVDLSVTFGDLAAVDQLSLDIETGERFAIMGPSGSGKSTLLRAIAGLEAPSSGTIVLDGVDVSGIAPHRRPIGLMFQDYALFPHMSVVDNVAYGLRMHGASTSSARRSASELLDLVGLAGFEDRSPASLSGGERQRVALARTLAPEPALVMLDEPLGSLDLTLRESLLSEMRSVIARVGATSLYVTHDRTEAFSFAQRLAIMRGGSIIRIGTPDSVWSDPGTTFVAKFIGHPNVVAGPVIGFAADAVTIPLSAISFDDDGPIVGSVRDSVFTDGSYETIVQIANGVTVKVTADDARAPGSQAHLRIDRGRVKALEVDEI
jgi:thiamine transport system ATP-binding protein